MNPTAAQQVALTPAELWLETHGDDLYKYAIARVRSPAVAEDLVQETLLAALTARERFTNSSSERTWLTGILKHKLLDHLGRSMRERPMTELHVDEEQQLFDKSGHWKVRGSAWRGNPHEVLENAEFRAVLDRCLSKLPRRIAHLFWLREADGVQSEELCQQLHISPTNLWTMMHRARLRLRTCLTLNWFEGGDS